MTVPQQSLSPAVIIIEMARLPIGKLKWSSSLLGVMEVELCVMFMMGV